MRPLATNRGQQASSEQTSSSEAPYDVACAAAPLSCEEATAHVQQGDIAHEPVDFCDSRLDAVNREAPHEETGTSTNHEVVESSCVGMKCVTCPSNKRQLEFGWAVCRKLTPAQASTLEQNDQRVPLSRIANVFFSDRKPRCHV